MRSVGSIATVLLGLFLSQVPCFAAGNMLYICNAGNVDLDGYLALQGGSVFTKRIAPAECALLAGSQGTLPPGYMGFGFTDVKGKWGGARRADKVPDWNTVVDSSFGLPTVLQRANRALSVKHGAENVTIPGLLAFQAQGPSTRPLDPGPADQNFDELPTSRPSGKVTCPPLRPVSSRE